MVNNRLLGDDVCIVVSSVCILCIVVVLKLIFISFQVKFCVIRFEVLILVRIICCVECNIVMYLCSFFLLLMFSVVYIVVVFFLISFLLISCNGLLLWIWL